MNVLETLQSNLLSPLSLAFALGVFAKVVRSDLKLPEQLYQALSIYLLLAIGLKGGVELAHASFAAIAKPAAATLLLGCATPVAAFLVLRKFCGFSAADSAGIAAHYGSVSAVTFIAAQQFATGMRTPAEGFMPTLVTLLESPGIFVALAIGVFQTAARPAAVSVTSGGTLAASPPTLGGLQIGPEALSALREVFTGRTMVLMVGGMLVGYLIGDRGYEPVKPFFETGFKGALTLFLLEMGLVAGSRLSDLRSTGPTLVAFGVGMPLLHGAIGAALGHWAGLSVGGTAVLATMAASASYIAAPPAVRMTLPDANPTLSLTASLAITFPFNLLVGIPLYHHLAAWLAA